MALVNDVWFCWLLSNRQLNLIEDWGSIPLESIKMYSCICFHLVGVARWHFDSYVSCVVITEHRTPSILIGQNPFMDWGSIPLENILLFNRMSLHILSLL
jgi:hypothetical protein